MKLCIYGTNQDKQIIIDIISKLPTYAYRKLSFTLQSEYSEFIREIRENDFDVFIVTMEDAAGMEGVIATRKLKADTPVIWFSKDSNFVAQSYRLSCTYFGVKPITKELFSTAMKKCKIF